MFIRISSIKSSSSWIRNSGSFASRAPFLTNSVIGPSDSAFASSVSDLDLPGKPLAQASISADSTDSWGGKIAVSRVISNTCRTSPLRRQIRSSPPFSFNFFAIVTKERRPILLMYARSPRSIMSFAHPSDMQDSHSRSNCAVFSASIRPATCSTTFPSTLIRSMVTIPLGCLMPR